ncbi:hypothetical protein QBC39DRAFT_329828 [Podospora conica]|nr:hypothetical protein QBC39DRAFT_329828 [Schizothecium conicum]
MVSSGERGREHFRYYAQLLLVLRATAPCAESVPARKPGPLTPPHTKLWQRGSVATPRASAYTRIHNAVKALERYVYFGGFSISYEYNYDVNTVILAADADNGAIEIVYVNRFNIPLLNIVPIEALSLIYSDYYTNDKADENDKGDEGDETLRRSREEDLLTERLALKRYFKDFTPLALVVRPSVYKPISYLRSCNLYKILLAVKNLYASYNFRNIGGEDRPGIRRIGDP